MVDPTPPGAADALKVAFAIAKTFVLNAGSRANTLQLMVVSNAQHRLKIIAALRENPARSNREIARQVGADRHTVAKLRRLLAQAGAVPMPARTVGRDGKARPAQRPDALKPAPTPIHTPAQARDALADYRQAGFPFHPAWRCVLRRIPQDANDLAAALTTTRAAWHSAYERKPADHRTEPVARLTALWTD